MSFIRFLKLTLPLLCIVAGAMALICNEKLGGVIFIVAGVVFLALSWSEFGELIKLARTDEVTVNET